MDNECMLRKITVISSYEDEYGYQEVNSPGFLTSEHYAMYFANDTHEIVVTNVVPSRAPNEYISISVYLPLGRIRNPPDYETIIPAVVTRLKEMTAYEFVTEVITNVWESFEFEGLIIPGIL